MTQPPNVPGNPPGPRPPAWQGPPRVPPGGYQVPPGPQAPVVKRIPEDQPFVARPSVLKRLLVFGPVALVVVLAFTCPLALVLTTESPDSTSGDIVAVLAFAGCMLFVVAGAVSLQVFLITSGGPVLAAGPAGLWIKTRPTRGQAIWLPWESIERISRRRWALEKMVVVKPRDPRTEGNLGVFTAIDSSLLKVFYGSGFTATLNFADRGEHEIMAAIAQYSNGRTLIV
ncbi:hypothetical protein GCM10010399_61620 [Dactylosporangium fulvum]|uniref:PH domain-containing protein n=1 Tax=Dactylosporangium fulvum TaxID=53359 RepID=A0ABY5VM58_9ACTN|nr:hypothetical protein [Dactylosporangium fulvum]UWP78723.1 hypothetical protein Dfulv_26500 [Dactylosporangium fulvum]